MEAINSAERSASIFNFALVYLLITAVPVGITYIMTKKAGSTSANAKAVVEQRDLAEEMKACQTFVKKMEEIDKTRPEETASSETWNAWINDADRQNNQFKNRVDQFQKNARFSGARLAMRDMACSYLYRVFNERRNYLAKRTQLLNFKDDTAEIQDLKGKVQGLEGEKTNLNTQNAMLQAQLAQMAATVGKSGGSGGSGGGGGGGGELDALKAELEYCEASSAKDKADLLEKYNDKTKRRELYTEARQDMMRIRQNPKASFAIRKQIRQDLDEIDRAMARL
ncbi:hypothetical protein ACAW74_23365 [Fibrella sp. WM1]|uniref:hypothetical protein n=1 Tax=Fibrella musci TaxID=3242485 RepID=UPI00352004B4